MNKYEVNIDGIAVAAAYPFSFKNVLDESLDEATITCYSATKNYKCGTLVEITVTEGAETETPTDKPYRFVVYNDTAQEMPVRSGNYKHTLALVEETKLLEGIVCPSLTFTNALGEEINRFDAVINITDLDILYEEPASPPLPPKDSEITLPGLIMTPIKRGSSLPSIREFGTAFLNANWNTAFGNIIKRDFLSEIDEKPSGVKYSSYISVTKGGEQLSKTSELDQGVILDVSDEILNVEYSIIFKTTYSPDNDSESIDYRWYQFNFEVFVQEARLPLKKWSITDCVLRVLECAKPLFEGENPEYTFNGVTYVNGVASRYESGSQAGEYDKILAPEFTMTQCTLREQLKVIGSFIHAEPRLYNGVILFDNLGLGEEWKAAPSMYTYKAPSIDFSNYATAIQSNASNVVSNSDTDVAVINQAARKVMGPMNQRTEATNAEAITDFKIQTVRKVEARVITYDNNGKITFNTEWWDITPYCFESNRYNTISEVSDVMISRNNAIYYKQGEPNLKGMFFVAQTAISSAKTYAITNIFDSVDYYDTLDYGKIQSILENTPTALEFKISYIPFYDASLIHGKPKLSDQPDFVLHTNQSENQIDTQYFGENIKGIAAKLGNEQEERTYILPSLASLPKLGARLDDYAISTISTEVMPDSIKCTVSLTKDFNRISEYIGVNSIKRLWEVSEREVYDRNIIIREKLVITYETPTEFVNTVHRLRGFNDMLESALFTQATPRPINLSTATSYSYDKKPILSEKRFATVSSAFGNATMATLSAKDNYSAGSKLAWVQSKVEGIEGYWREDVPYADYYGRIYWLLLSFQHAELSDRSSGDYPNAMIDNNLTYIRTNDSHYLRLRKDSRERITITCLLEAVSAEPNLYAGSSLAELNYMVSQTLPGQLYLYVFKKEVNLDKFASVFDFPESDYDAYNLTDYADVFNEEKYIQLIISGKTYNNGYGYIIATEPKIWKQKVVDEKGEEIEYAYNEGGKILLTCTQHKQSGNHPLKLYFYITK